MVEQENKDSFPKDLKFDNASITLRFFKSRGCCDRITIEVDNNRIVGVDGEPTVKGEIADYVKQGWTALEL